MSNLKIFGVFLVLCLSVFGLAEKQYEIEYKLADIVHSKIDPPVFRIRQSDHEEMETAMLEAYRPGNYVPGVFSEEYRLYSDLLGLSNYSKSVRPVRNHSHDIKVFVGMCVMMIEDLIERDQTMVTSACLKMLWIDEFLRWEPKKYGNLSWIAIDSNAIWIPDIAIVNSPDPLGLTKKPITVGVTHHGEVGFFPSGRLTTRCNLYITYFPVRFESWIHPTPYMVIELYPGTEAIDLKEYYENFQWSLKSYKVLLAVVSYDNKNFSSITITYRLWRKSTFYFMYFIFPQFLLSALQTLSHTLPVEHPGRMSMLTALFIGTSVTHAGIATHIPKSSDSISVLQIYLTFMSCNLVIVLLITFVMLYTVLRHPNEEPSFWSMIHAFFSIVWPSKPNDDSMSDDPLNAGAKRGKCTNSVSSLKKDNIDTPGVVLPVPANEAVESQIIAPLRYDDDYEDGLLSRANGHVENTTVFTQLCEMPPINNSVAFNVDFLQLFLIIWTQMIKNCPSHDNLRQYNSGASSSIYLQLVDNDNDIETNNLRVPKFVLPPRSRAETGCSSVSFDVPPAKKRQCLAPSRKLTRADSRRPTPRKNIFQLEKNQWNGDFSTHCDCSDDTLKKRWIEYCVALDKTIMYFNGLINITLPLVLFYLLPLLHNSEF